MAQTGKTAIKLYGTNTASAVPLAANLVNDADGVEVAVNTTDKRLFVKDGGGTVVEVGINPTTITTTTINATGNVILGDASTDTVTVNGYMGIGGAGSSVASVYASSTALTGTSQYGLYSDITANSSATSNVFGVYSRPRTAASAFTVSGTVYGFYAADVSKGAGSTITNQSGITVSDQTQGTNNYGITSAVSSGANKWNIYASGTAQNYFAGNVGVGVTPSVSTGIGASVLELGAVGNLFAGNAVVSSITQNAYYTSGYKYGTTAAASYYQQTLGQHRWFTAPSGTAGTAITFTQSLAVGNGTTLALQGATSVTGVGVSFPATQVASSDANTLDDYEEGTFTPTLVGTSTAGVGTYTAQVGRYTKIGRMVHVSLSVVWTAHTGTGNMRISGLPFTAVAAATTEWLCVPEFLNMTMPASTTPFAIVQQNSANINLYSQAVGSGTVSPLAMDTAASVYLSIEYEAA